jgi:hypothetical protein
MLGKLAATAEGLSNVLFTAVLGRGWTDSPPSCQSCSWGEAAAGYQAGGWGTEHPCWQHPVLSTVHDMAFVRARTQ